MLAVVLELPVPLQPAKLIVTAKAKKNSAAQA
jgi:hypothetical protein